MALHLSGRYYEGTEIKNFRTEFAERFKDQPVEKEQPAEKGQASQYFFGADGCCPSFIFNSQTEGGLDNGRDLFGGSGGR